MISKLKNKIDDIISSISNTTIQVFALNNLLKDQSETRNKALRAYYKRALKQSLLNREFDCDVFHIDDDFRKYIKFLEFVYCRRR